MKVAIYVRVSTQEQAEEGYSVGVQTDKLSTYCLAKDWDVYRVYTDPGFSGSNMARPALQQLLRDIKSGGIDMVLVYKLDRLSRSQKDTLYLIEDVFLANSINFVSMNENFDTTNALGRAMVGIISVFAQLEREQIRERTMMGKSARAKDGYFHGGPYYPIGYDYINGELVVNEYEALQVREAYDLWNAGASISNIRDTLASKYTNRYGSWYSASSVYSVLTSHAVVGKIKYNDEIYDGRHAAIVNAAAFEKAQARFTSYERVESIKGAMKTPFKHTQLLGGMVLCGHCQARYYVKGNYSGHGEKRKLPESYRPYYTCYSRGKSNVRQVRDPNCKNKTWFVGDLNKIVVDEVKKLSFDPDYFDEVVSSSGGSVQSENIEIIQNRIAEIDKQLGRVMDLYQLGTLPMDKLTDRVGILNSERGSLDSELVTLLSAHTSLPVAEAKAILVDVDAAFSCGSLDEQRAVLQSLIDYIVLDGDKVKIHWSFV